MEDRLISWNLYRVGAGILILSGALVAMVGSKSDFLLWLTYHRHTPLDYYFYYITRAGEVTGYVLVGLLLLLSSWRKMAVVPILGGLVMGITYGLKLFFKHERPALLLDRIHWAGPMGVLDYHMLTGHSSFPSGHSMAAWALFTFTAAVTRKGWVSVLCLFLAASVSISRVYLMAHFLQDVVMGAATGFLIGYLAYQAYQHWVASPA